MGLRERDVRISCRMVSRLVGPLKRVVPGQSVVTGVRNGRGSPFGRGRTPGVLDAELTQMMVHVQVRPAEPFGL